MSASAPDPGSSASSSSGPGATTRPLRERVRAARASLIAAAVLLVLAGLGLTLGERRELSRVEGFSEGRGEVVGATVDHVAPELEGRLVHVSGQLQPVEPLRDESLGVVLPALRLHRSVEMFQWVEREEEVVAANGEKKRVKAYGKSWASVRIDSRQFAEPKGHENPTELPYAERDVAAERGQLGAYTVPKEAILALSNFAPLPADQEMIDRAPRDVRSRLKVFAGALYLGADPNQPAIGDCRIGLQVVHPETVTLVARQSGSELLPYRTRAGTELLLVQAGIASVDAVFGEADDGTPRSVWALRGVALLLVAAASTLLLRPLSEGAPSAPRVGRFVLPGLALLGLSTGAVITGLAVGALWVGQRPWLGGAAFLLALAGLAAGAALVVRGRRAALR